MDQIPRNTPILAQVCEHSPADVADSVLLFWRDRLIHAEKTGLSLEQLVSGAWLWVVLDQSGTVVEARPADCGPGGVKASLGQHGDRMRWRDSAQPPSRMRILQFRHRVLRAVRDWFDGQGFIEMPVPVLVPAPSPEPHFSPIQTGEGYLSTSPEFQLKRMLAGGFEKPLYIGPAFRGGELGPWHNPEFTLLEWYRAGEDSKALLEDCQSLLATLAPLCAEFARELPPERREAHAALAESLKNLPYATCSVSETCANTLGIHLKNRHSVEGLREALREAGRNTVEPPGDYALEFSRLWIDVEEQLPLHPLFITEWPAPLASLARLHPADPSIAERLELYVRGVELANGFSELTDPAEQRRRFQADLAARETQRLPSVPLDARFLEALEGGLPPCAGMAMGVERLVMLLSGAGHIREVLPFAWEER